MIVALGWLLLLTTNRNLIVITFVKRLVSVFEKLSPFIKLNNIDYLFTRMSNNCMLFLSIFMYFYLKFSVKSFI